MSEYWPAPYAPPELDHAVADPYVNDCNGSLQYTREGQKRIIRTTAKTAVRNKTRRDREQHRQDANPLPIMRTAYGALLSSWSWSRQGKLLTMCSPA
jgi:hypothetical protein